MNRNSRDLGFGLKIPTREWQIYILRWSFCILYLAQGGLLTVILILSSGPNGYVWILNSITDFLLVLWFYLFCRNVARCNVSFIVFLFIYFSCNYLHYITFINDMYDIYYTDNGTEAIFLASTEVICLLSSQSRHHFQCPSRREYVYVPNSRSRCHCQQYAVKRIKYAKYVHQCVNSSHYEHFDYRRFCIILVEC
jgi:hypothetical protein